MRLTPLLAAVVLASLPCVGPAMAQAAAEASATTPTNARALVAEIRRIVAERYVLPERRPALDAVLAEGLAAGRYDVADPGQMAERINADLERVGKDKHLNLRFDPAAAAMMAPGGEANGDTAGYERAVRLQNHGIRELRVLEGNVRLMTYDGFHAIGTDTIEAITQAMRFLSGGDAVIIDLRANGGGNPEAVQAIISHFLPANTPLVTFYMNGEADPNVLATLADPPAGRMIGKPLYVLTSGGTGSAAEEFTGHVLGYDLGEVVGANTAGAGFRNDLIPIAGQFPFSISVGRAVLASTGKDWEGVGHAPTLPASVEGALDVAHGHALGRLAQTASADDRPRFEALADGIAARGEPRTPALALSAYAGVYGERVVSVDGDRLSYRRAEGAPKRLIALGANRFTFVDDPAFVLTFQASGPSVEAFEIQRVGQPVQGRYARGAP